MKKKWIKTWIFIGTVILLFIPALAWSQTQYQSLQSQTSFGLFENAFDAAFNPTDAKPEPTFTTLEQNYFFGGLTNFSELSNTYSFTMVPLRLGYYHTGSMPWSGLSDILVDTTNSTRSNGITPTTATKPVTVGNTTTNYTWVTHETDNQYDSLEAWNTALGGQFLIGLGFVNTGLGVRWDKEQNASGAAINTWADANRTITDTYYYDPTAGTVAPSPVADYSRHLPAGARIRGALRHKDDCSSHRRVQQQKPVRYKRGGRVHRASAARCRIVQRRCCCKLDNR